MRKVLIYLLLSVLILSGCRSVKFDDLLNDYNLLVDSYLNMESYTLNVNSKKTVYHLNNEKKVTEERESSVVNTLMSDKVNNNYFINVINEKNSYVSNAYYIDDMIYLNNDGYKLSYQESRENIDNHLNEVKGIVPVKFLMEDVENIKVVKLDNKVTYDFKLNKQGKEKLLKANNFLGYGKVFKLSESDFNYKVISVDNIIVEIIADGFMEGMAVDQNNKIKFLEICKYSSINDTKVKKPMDYKTYPVNEMDEQLEKEYVVSDLNSYKLFLLDIGYIKENTSYKLVINKELSFMYDFENYTYSCFNNKNIYHYNYEEDTGFKAGCKYSFALNKSIDETQCSIRDINELLNTKNSFEYDLYKAKINVDLLLKG